MSEPNWNDWTVAGMLTTQRDASGRPSENGNMLSYSAQAEFFTGGDPLFDIVAHEVELGVYSRSSRHPENTQIDDYLSLGCIPVCAQRILIALKKNIGFLDVTHPEGPSWNWKQWFYRFPALVPHLKYSIKTRPGVLLRFAWALSVWLASREPYRNQDGWMQSHLMVLIYEQSGKRTWLCDWACRVWRARKPESMKSIVSAYIGTENHPLVQVWAD